MRGAGKHCPLRPQCEWPSGSHQSTHAPLFIPNHRHTHTISSAWPALQMALGQAQESMVPLYTDLALLSILPHGELLTMPPCPCVHPGGDQWSLPPPVPTSTPPPSSWPRTVAIHRGRAGYLFLKFALNLEASQDCEELWRSRRCPVVSEVCCAVTVSTSLCLCRQSLGPGGWVRALEGTDPSLVLLPVARLSDVGSCM